jgi:hypothetical protein
MCVYSVFVILDQCISLEYKSTTASLFCSPDRSLYVSESGASASSVSSSSFRLSDRLSLEKKLANTVRHCSFAELP